ncbi:hypothetical protein [Natronosalvus caseinilyticus]|uniref:hypothetical protein n=1 Tax=Natronosalvus caseinilyticus TaxID=2953747 RepID=UPI0028B13389|nr:hypothetical protein [Natronosalvus caseinilyticus]
MNRRTSMALTIALFVVAVAVPFAAASVVPNGAVQEESDTENESVAPGEQLSAAVGVQDADLEGDVSERAFGLELANAESDEAKAAIIAERHGADESRLEDLEGRLETLNESREAGEISEGRYRAEVAKVVAEMGSVERRAAIAANAAGELPTDVLSAQGVDVEEIRTLRERAGERGGPDTAATARSIAGEGVGQPMDDRSPDGGNEPARDGGNESADTGSSQGR